MKTKLGLLVLMLWLGGCASREFYFGHREVTSYEIKQEMKPQDLRSNRCIWTGQGCPQQPALGERGGS